MAFVLTLAAPLLHRVGGRTRVVTAVAALVVFGAVTRWEPSVIRAVVMAVIAVWAVTNGRAAGTRRVLALAVTLLVLVDPMLARSLGFLLSVGASAGIALLASRLERVLPTPLAVTLAAQAGVAPVLLPAFGAMPLVAVAANLLALPAAGPLMMWGLAAGLPAGLLGGAVAHVLHLPTHALLWWISTVARTCAALPVGAVTPRSALALLAVAAAAWAAAHVVLPVARARRHHDATDAAAPMSPPVRAPAVAGIAFAAGLVLLAAGPVVGAVGKASRTGAPIVDDALVTTSGERAGRLWRAGRHAVIVAEGRLPPGTLLGALRARHISSVDVLVVTSRAADAGDAVSAAASRVPIGLVFAPPDRRFGVPSTPTVGLRPGVRARAGPFTVTVVRARPGNVRAQAGGRGAVDVNVQVASPRAARARPP